MKVLHVKGKKTEEHKDEEGRYIFLDGDVYVVDDDLDIWIWIGQDCGVDEKTVGAWVANKIDNEERGGEPKVTTVLQGEEPEEFKNLLEYEVIDGDTPGFLEHAELDMVEYKLFRVYTKEETASFDEAFVEEVPLKKGSLNSNDVYILDGNEGIYTWIGSEANREERVEGQKLMQKIDSSRQYLPIQYTVYEGEGGKSEKAFYDFLERAAKVKGPVLSVEDQRELEYRPEEYKTAEDHKKEVDKEFGEIDPSDIKKPQPQTVADLPPDRSEIPSMSKEDIERGSDRLDSVPAQAYQPEPKVETPITKEPEIEPPITQVPEIEPLVTKEPKMEPLITKESKIEVEKKPVIAAKVEVFAKPKPKPVKSSDAVKLYFIDGAFIENPKIIGEAQATLEILGFGLSGTSRLSFAEDVGLILRRTASRQAESVTKSGFLLRSGERVGLGTRLEIIEADKISEAHLREGHKYNR